MKKHFYSHLVQIDTVHIELSDMDLTDNERDHLLQLAESNLHHKIIDAVLSQLTDDEKKVFLRQIHTDDHANVWRFLNKKSKHIESLIKETADDLIDKMHKDIKEAKKKH